MFGPKKLITSWLTIIPDGNAQARVSPLLQVLCLGEQVPLASAVLEQGLLPRDPADDERLAGQRDLAQQQHVQLSQLVPRITLNTPSQISKNRSVIISLFF